MNQPQHDYFTRLQKNLNPLKDFSTYVPEDSLPKKSCHPFAHPMLDSETRSFVVSWQLPGVAYKDIHKSNS